MASLLCIWGWGGLADKLKKKKKTTLHCYIQAQTEGRVLCHSIIISIIIPAQWASGGDRNQAFRKRASTSTLYRSDHCKALQAAGGQDSNPGLSAQGCFSHAATFLHSFPRNEDAAHTHHYERVQQGGGGCPPSPAGNHWKLTHPSL